MTDYGSFIVATSDDHYTWVEFPADATKRRIIKAKILLGYWSWLLIPLFGPIFFAMACDDWLLRKRSDRTWGDGSSWEQMSVDVRSTKMTKWLTGKTYP
jgi:hypothetical protein